MRRAVFLAGTAIRRQRRNCNCFIRTGRPTVAAANSEPSTRTSLVKFAKCSCCWLWWASPSTPRTPAPGGRVSGRTYGPALWNLNKESSKPVLPGSRRAAAARPYMWTCFAGSVGAVVQTNLLICTIIVKSARSVSNTIVCRGAQFLWNDKLGVKLKILNKSGWQKAQKNSFFL